MSGKLFALTKNSDPEEADRIIAQIKKDESELKLATFSPDDAWEIGSAIRAKFLETQKNAATLTTLDAHKERYGHLVYQKFSAESGIVIHIETFTGLVLFTATAGPPTNKPNNLKWIQGKMNIVKANHRSSYAVGREWSRRDRDVRPAFKIELH